MRKKKGLESGLLYLALHNQLVKKYGVGMKVPRKEIFAKIGRHYMIPKSLRHIVIKEMESFNLLKILDRDNVLILNSKLNLERDYHKLLLLYNSYGSVKSLVGDF